MSSTSGSITWQRWAQKWGDWTTWFPKGNVQSEPLRRSIVVRTAGVERQTENVPKGTTKNAVTH